MNNQWLKFFLIPFLLLTCIACRQPAPPIAQSTLRISMEEDPTTLDPRRVRDLATTTIIHMLYEGLMRTEPSGLPTPALAEQVTVSPDQKTYTFHLRTSHWSNGQPVTAQDFEQTWKSLLDPKFPSPNAYQLYVIRGAQAAKEGKVSLDHIGVHAQDSSTLIVELEQPTPYFFHLLSSHFFYPVHASLRQQSADASISSNAQIVTNGPFKLESWKRRNELTAISNSHYWDQGNIKLDRIQYIVLDNPTALQLFQRGELDWTGSPLSTLSIDALASLKDEGQLEVMPSAAVYIFRVNTQHPPFQHTKMRQAFALAINRQELVEHALQGNQQPAFGIIPPSFLQGEPFFQDNDVALARQLFQEALKEQNLTLQNFPSISICYASNERAHKIAQVAQQQWKENLGIQVALQSSEAKVYYDRLKKYDYQLGIGSWFADIRDPISFLDVFKLKENGTNNTQWENPQYIKLLNQSSLADPFSERKELLKEAEKIIISEMPIIPLFYSSFNYVKNPKIKGIYFSELGYLDFKNAHWEKNE